MTKNEKELLSRFLNWLYDSGLEHIDARFEGMEAPDMESVIDKFEKSKSKIQK